MSDTRKPIERLIDSAMKCTRCGVPMGFCDCWTQCECGWSFSKCDGVCRNPVHRLGPKFGPKGTR